mgnify:FL=1
MRLERFTFSTSPSFVYNTPSVLTTSSLAPTPEISPIPNFQSNPSGLITGSMLCLFVRYMNFLVAQPRFRKHHVVDNTLETR